MPDDASAAFPALRDAATIPLEDIDVSKVDVSMNGIELQDREFIAAIREKREPNASVQQVVPAMRTLGRLEDLLKSAG